MNDFLIGIVSGLGIYISGIIVSMIIIHFIDPFNIRKEKINDPISAIIMLPFYFMGFFFELMFSCMSWVAVILIISDIIYKKLLRK